MISGHRHHMYDNWEINLSVDVMWTCVFPSVQSACAGIFPRFFFSLLSSRRRNVLCIFIPWLLIGLNFHPICRNRFAEIAQPWLLWLMKNSDQRADFGVQLPSLQTKLEVSLLSLTASLSSLWHASCSIYCHLKLLYCFVATPIAEEPDCNYSTSLSN